MDCSPPSLLKLLTQGQTHSHYSCRKRGARLETHWPLCQIQWPMQGQHPCLMAPGELSFPTPSMGEQIITRQNNLSTPIWGSLWLRSCISSVSFAHAGGLRQHKYHCTDSGGHAIRDATHFSSCTSPIRFHREISAVSCLQSQHKSFAKPHHAYSCCAKLNPGVSTCNSQPWLAVIHCAWKETFVILPVILLYCYLSKDYSWCKSAHFHCRQWIYTDIILFHLYLPSYLWFCSYISCLATLFLPVSGSLYQNQIVFLQRFYM